MAYLSGLLINQNWNEHWETQCCATTTQKQQTNKQLPNFSRHILFHSCILFQWKEPLAGKRHNHIFEVPKGENIRTKGQFHLCVSWVELWTCLPATDLILSFKIHLNLGWGRDKRARTDPKSVEKWRPLQELETSQWQLQQLMVLLVFLYLNLVHWN